MSFSPPLLSSPYISLFLFTFPFPFPLFALSPSPSWIVRKHLISSPSVRLSLFPPYLQPTKLESIKTKAPERRPGPKFTPQPRTSVYLCSGKKKHRVEKKDGGKQKEEADGGREKKEDSIYANYYISSIWVSEG